MSSRSQAYHQYSRHVSSALSPDKLDFYRKYPKYVKKRFPAIEPAWFVDVTTGAHLGIIIFPWIESQIQSLVPMVSPESSDTWNLLWDTVTESINIQVDSLTNGLKNKNTSTFNDSLRNLHQSRDLFEAAQTKIFIINIHDEIDQVSETSIKSFKIPSLPHVKFVGDLVVLENFPGGPIVITYQMFLNSLDKLEARFSWLFYVEYMSNHPTRVEYETKQLFHQIYDTLEDGYKRNGNENIRVCKLLEPLLVGVSLQALDPETHDHNFGDIIRHTFSEERTYLNSTVESLWNIGKEYLRKHGPNGIPFLLEQYGQEKLHNYPIVSIEGGLKKMHLYGTSIRVSEEQAVRDIASNFKREYFVAYYEKHKILPKVIDNWRLDERIRRLIKRGRPGTIRECFRIPNEAWFTLEYDKNHDFNYYPQISDLLDDKAITPHKDHIYQLFAQDALDVMSLKKPYTAENTRLILEILDRPVIDIKAFYEEVEKLGHLPENWSVIQLMAKERELKIEARAFSILTFECRMMASACERNLGEEILPLFKQQSMTLSGSELKHKMDILSTLPETEEYVWIAFMHDLQQWNYTFRSFQQAYLINVLCTLFGVNHFRYLMNIFTDSMLFSANKFTPPGFPGQFTMWDTHSGGNQGILQRLWTLITIITIRNEMHKMDLEHRLTGSGDNQVLFVKLRKGAQLEQMILSIKNKLRAAFEAIGLALKVEETWTSKDLVCYQRKYYYKGVLVPGGIKISARAFSGSGDINAGLNSVVTTAINGGIALTDQHSDPILGPAFAYTEIFLNLLGHREWKRVTPNQKRPLVLLSMLSSDYGFLPFIQLTGFLYAGHQDTLSESLALLKYVWDKKPEYRPLIAGAVRFKVGEKGDESRLQLVIDPTTLNIDRPKLPEAIIKTRVEEFLMSPTNVVNKQLRIMFDCCKKDDQIRLAEELLKIRPINTALLHSLFEYSHIGSLLGTLARFNKISSIVKLVGLNKMGSETNCFSKQVRILDIVNLKYFFKRITNRVAYGLDFIPEVVSCDPGYYLKYCRTNHLHPDCVFSCRLFLIAYSYGLNLEFITGPYTPPPQEQLIFHDQGLPDNLESTLLINPCYNIPRKLYLLEQTRGSYNLYIGSRTADPVRTIKLTSLDGVEAGTAIKTLLKILAWMKSTNSHDNIVNFIMTQLGSRMEGLEELIPGLVPGTAGGCIDHRFGSPGTVMWAFSNSTSIISTWYQITSNRATLLQRGEEDRFVFFQQLFHHIYSALRFCDPYRNRFGVIIRTDHCSYPIPDSIFTSPKLMLPGREHLLGGLVLDQVRKDALRREALHYQEVMRNSTLYRGTGEEILSAVLGQHVASSVIHYSLGLEDLSYEDHRILHNQTTINLSILRKVPLKKVLSSIALHLGLLGYFGPYINYSKLITQLQSRQMLGASSQSMTPFLDIIQAIITGGYLPQLMTLTSTYWKWDSTLSLINLIGPLLKGMQLALEEWREFPYPIYLLVEVRGSHYSYDRVIQFLYYWNSLIAHTIRVNPSLRGARLIEEINSTYSSLQIMLVTDKGIATEHGRRLITQQMPLEVTHSNENQHLITKPQLLNPSTAPWILTSVGTAPLYHQLITEMRNLYAQGNEWNEHSRNITKIMRWNKAVSRGKFKLSEIFSRLSLSISEDSLIISLAEGPGSFLGFLLHLQPRALGLYNSKIPPENTPPAMAGLYFPPELLCPCGIHKRVLNLPESSTHFGELTVDKTWNELNLHVMGTSNRKKLVTCDMQYIPGDTLIVINNLMYWIELWKPETVILKIMLNMLIDETTDWLPKLCSQFSTHNWIKPTFSNPCSLEVYLVLQNPRATGASAIPYSITGLLENWRNHLSTLNEEYLGTIICESLSMNLKMSFCPNFVMNLDIKSLEENGGLFTMIKDPFIYTFRSIYKKYWLGHELDRTEQTMLHSLSIQSRGIRRRYQAIMRATELYLRIRGLLFSEFAQEASLRYIRTNAKLFLHLLLDEEHVAEKYHNWDESLQILGLFLSSTDSLGREEIIVLLKSWIWITLKDDHFLLFNDYPVGGRHQLLNRLTAITRGSALEWTDLLFRPSNFYVLTKGLMAFIKHINWTSCQITVENSVLAGLVELLPWPPELTQESSRMLVISGSIDSPTTAILSQQTYIKIALGIQIGPGVVQELALAPVFVYSLGSTSLCIYA